jgi:hypothetical protein
VTVGQGREQEAASGFVLDADLEVEGVGRGTVAGENVAEDEAFVEMEMGGRRAEEGPAVNGTVAREEDTLLGEMLLGKDYMLLGKDDMLLGEEAMRLGEDMLSEDGALQGENDQLLGYDDVLLDDTDNGALPPADWDEPLLIDEDEDGPWPPGLDSDLDLLLDDGYLGS